MCRRLRDHEEASPPNTRDAGWEPQLAGRCPEVVGQRLTCMRTYCRDRCGYGAGISSWRQIARTRPGPISWWRGTAETLVPSALLHLVCLRPRRPSEPRERRDAAPARGASRAQDQIELLALSAGGLQRAITLRTSGSSAQALERPGVARAEPCRVTRQHVSSRSRAQPRPLIRSGVIPYGVVGRGCLWLLCNRCRSDWAGRRRPARWS